MLQCLPLAGFASAYFCSFTWAQLSQWAICRAPPHSRHACLLTAQHHYFQSAVILNLTLGSWSHLTEDFLMVLATSISVAFATVLWALVKKRISAEVTAAEKCWIHQHFWDSYSWGLARWSSATFFPNVLLGCQGGPSSAGRETTGRFNLGHFCYIQPSAAGGAVMAVLVCKTLSEISLAKLWRTVVSAKVQTVPY